MILHPPKSTLRKVVFNPNARAAQFYNVVEDLAQAACAMSTLEVLQSYPTQCKNLLTALGAMDLSDMNLIHFNIENLKPRLPHQLDFQVITRVVGKKVFSTVLDEGASNSVLSLSCWKSIGSPKLVKSPTTLKSFDAKGFQPYGLMPTLSVELGGKTVLHSGGSSGCPVRLQSSLREKLVLRYDRCCFDGIYNPPVSAFGENCNN